MTNDVEHLFMCLLGICMSVFGKVSIQIFSFFNHFLCIKLSEFLIYFEYLQIFPPFFFCWFPLQYRNFLVCCSPICLFLHLVWDSKNHHQGICQGALPPMFSFRNFMVSVPKFKPLIKLIWLSWFHVWYKIRIHLYFHLLIFCFSNTVYLRRHAYLKEVATISVCTWWQGLETSVPTSCWCHSSSCW